MSNEDFDYLLKLKKKFIDINVELPQSNSSGIYDIVGSTTKDKFFLDVNRRGKIELSKFKIQKRYAITKLPLVRIDIDSPPHINPDGTKTSRNHIHVYRETDNDTGNLPWAYDLDYFEDMEYKSMNFMDIFYGFCEYCNIDTDNVQGVL